MRARREPKQLLSFIRKLRVYAIADQDAWGDQKGTGEWIREEFPHLRYVESGPLGMNRFTALFRGMYQNDSAGGSHPVVQLVRDDVVPLSQQDWVEANVQQGHGQLGADYPLVKHNPSAPNNTIGLKEGDTPSWFFVLRNGLSDPAHLEFGGWGGRFQPAEGGHYVDAEDGHWSDSEDPGVRRKWTVARWREAYQHDMAARMDWCVAERYEDANHNPVVSINGDTGRDVVRLPARSGETVRIAAAATDPDGDKTAYRWFVYHEAGNVESVPQLNGDSSESVSFVAPDVGQPSQLHVICEVTDDGEPNLYGYRRIVVTVRPAITR